MIIDFLADDSYCDCCCKWKYIIKIEIELGLNLCVMSSVIKVAEIPLVLYVSRKLCR